jgi:glutamine synthetase
MTTAKDVLKMIKDNDVKYVDLRFTDPRGKWQHVTFDVGMIDEDTFAEGQMFDGSSIAGWKAINESDMKLMPDPVTATSIRSSPRPRWSSPATCSSRPPASPTTATRAASPRRPRPMVKSMGVGDTVFFGPEAEFFVFDDVRYQTDALQHRLQARLVELPINSDTEYEGGNLGHRIRHQGRLLPGAAAGLGAGHALGNARRHGRRWASRSRSITTKWRPPSTSSA